MVDQRGVGLVAHRGDQRDHGLAAARTTASSLNAHRSSIDPPPRATITTSGRGTGPPASGRPENPRIAAATLLRGALTLTSTGHTSTRHGKLVGEAVQDVPDDGTRRRRHYAHDRGQEGQGPLPAGVEQPLGRELLLALLQERHEGTGARGLDPLDHELVLGAPRRS